MAGRKQHYVPQFFQRGFGVPTPGKPKMIWVFQKGQQPALAEIKRTAREWDFYSQPAPNGSPTLDGKLTNLETELARRVAEVRAIPAGESVNASVAASIVAHLAPRTSHIRATFEHGMKGLLTGAIGALTDSDNVKRLLGLNGEAPSDRFLQNVSRTLKDDGRFGHLGLPEPVLEQMAFQLAKENFDQLFKVQLPTISSALGSLISNAESLARDGHNKALDSAIEKDVRQQLLATFIWSVEAAPAVGAVLPDCVAVGVIGDQTNCPFMLASNDELQAVVMPLSSRKLLVGRRSSAPFPDLSHINEDAIACSHTFYMAASDAGVLAELSPLIGCRSSALVDDVLEEALDEYRPKQAAAPLLETSAAATIEGHGTEDTRVPDPPESQALNY